MKSNYINGKIIDISEKGSWTEATLKDKESLQDVILIEKNITIESEDGKVHDIYCSKNINFKTGEYVYISLKNTLNKREVIKLYKDKNEYKEDIKKEKIEIKNSSKGNISFMCGFFSIILTFVFQPVLKTIIENITYIENIPQAGEDANIARSIFESIGPNSPLFNDMLYLMTFLMIYNVSIIFLNNNKGLIKNKKSVSIKPIEHNNKKDFKVNEIVKNHSNHENISCKISLTKK